MNKFEPDIIENPYPRKGPFWVTADEVIAYPVKLTVNPVLSHKEAWQSIKYKIRTKWNYYPRGRIEIRNGKAVVFLSSYCYEYAQLEYDLRRLFALGSIEMVWKTDDSAHYLPKMH